MGASGRVVLRRRTPVRWRRRRQCCVVWFVCACERERESIDLLSVALSVFAAIIILDVTAARNGREKVENACEKGLA